MSVLPPTPLDQWSYAFTNALYVKTNFDVEEIRHFSPRPELVLPAPEPTPSGVETATQQTVRAGRDAAAKKAAEDIHAVALKEWKETSATGLNLAAANQKGKILVIHYVGPGRPKSFQAASAARACDGHTIW